MLRKGSQLRKQPAENASRPRQERDAAKQIHRDDPESEGEGPTRRVGACRQEQGRQDGGGIQRVEEADNAGEQQESHCVRHPIARVSRTAQAGLQMPGVRRTGHDDDRRRTVGSGIRSREDRLLSPPL